MHRRAILYALASAALFGLSTPAAKVLLGTIHPAILAGLLYSGAGIGVGVLRRVRPRVFGVPNAPQVPLQRNDVPWLAAAIAAGGVVGPLLLMFGLARTDAATASLLLALEGAATAIMAWFIFRENFDRRVALGMACLMAGALVLSWSGAPSMHNVAGPLAIVAACLAWVSTLSHFGIWAPREPAHTSQPRRFLVPSSPSLSSERTSHGRSLRLGPSWD